MDEEWYRRWQVRSNYDGLPRSEHRYELRGPTIKIAASSLHGFPVLIVG